MSPPVLFVPSVFLLLSCSSGMDKQTESAPPSQSHPYFYNLLFFLTDAFLENAPTSSVMCSAFFNFLCSSWKTPVQARFLRLSVWRHWEHHGGLTGLFPSGSCCVLLNVLVAKQNQLVESSDPEWFITYSRHENESIPTRVKVCPSADPCSILQGCCPLAVSVGTTAGAFPLSREMLWNSWGSLCSPWVCQVWFTVSHFFLLSVNQPDVCLVTFSPLSGCLSEWVIYNGKISCSNLNRVRAGGSTDTVLLIVAADFK